MKGYKASYDGYCMDQLYEVGKTYELTGELKICQNGFHFCEELKNVFEYYSPNKNEKLVVFEIEALGEVKTEDDKSVTNKIKILRILDPKEYSDYVIQEFDKNNNVIYSKNLDGFEEWRKFDKNNNLIYWKNSNGYEVWKEYDENDNLIYLKKSNGYEVWNEYDENNNLIHLRTLDGYERWQEYDENNNLIYWKDSNGYERWNEYDESNYVIYFKDSDGYEQYY